MEMFAAPKTESECRKPAHLLQESSEETVLANSQADESRNLLTNLAAPDITVKNGNKPSLAVVSDFDFGDDQRIARNRQDEIHDENVWRASGIHLAPFSIPLRRRMQTAAVFLHCMSIAILVSLFWFTCANPFTWPVLIPYLIHLLVSSVALDGSLAYRSEWLRSLSLWKFFAGYFPMRLHKTHDLSPTRKYIIGYHPHGIISHGAWSAFATDALGFSEKFPGITNSLLTLDSNFRLPFYRDWILAMGIRSVSKESIRNILSKGGPSNDGRGRAVTIVIGGARESLEAEPGTLRLILKNRKGFVKMALRTGSDLVPAIGFGENDLYDQLSPRTHPLVHKLQMSILRLFKFTIPALHGRGLLNYDVGLMPYRRPVNIVMGRPIKTHDLHEPQPLQADVDRYHGLYVDEVERLFTTYRGQFSRGTGIIGLYLPLKMTRLSPRKNSAACQGTALAGTVSRVVTSKRKEAQNADESDEEAARRPGKRTKIKAHDDGNSMALSERTPVRSLGKAMYIGAHVSAAGGVQNSVANAFQIGANAFALFLKSQRKWSSPPITTEARDLFVASCKDHGYNACQHALPHGSYLVNLAQADEAKAAQAYGSFIDDLERCEKLGIKLYNFHPGSTLGDARPAAIARIASQLNKSHKATKTVVTVLENMAGSGNIIGSTWEDLRDIIALVKNKERVGVCIDTCHAFAAGYDLRSPAAYEATMKSFDDVVGVKYLKAMHLNDSKAPFGSNRDLHANIGTGFLGLRAFHSIMNDDTFANMPLVLETPTDGKDPTGKTSEDQQIWADEIKLLESLVGIDPESSEFKAQELVLQARGAAERSRIQDQVDKKSAKEAKKDGKAATSKKRQKRGREKAKETSESDGDNTQRTLELGHERPQADAPVAVSLEPALHAATNFLRGLKKRHLGVMLGGRGGRVEQQLEAVAPEFRLPVALQGLTNPVFSAGAAQSVTLIAARRLHVLAEKQAVDSGGKAVVVDLPRPRAALAHLGAILGARLPVGNELDVGCEGRHVDAPAKIDENEAPGRPAAAAVGVPLRRQWLISWQGIEPEHAVVGLEIAVHDALSVKRIDGPQQLDGEKHDK
ncbi:hypothetical protein CP533_5262 [Ophiocordyceps camponoti-saundersi (nom. inval.)]|nr:hypothetical protein CP533_5262 [Ophiocordyceps camponoti-saundersi (nom. inval.)]